MPRGESSAHVDTNVGLEEVLCTDGTVVGEPPQVPLVRPLPDTFFGLELGHRKCYAAVTPYNIVSL